MTTAIDTSRTTRRQRLLTLDSDADDLLTAWTGGGKQRGRLVSRLVFEESARLEERQRIRAVLEAPSGEEVTA